MHTRLWHSLKIVAWLVLGWVIPLHAHVLEVQRPTVFRPGLGAADTRTQKITLTNRASESDADFILLEASIKLVSLVSSESEPMFSIENPQPKEFPMVIKPGETRFVTINYNNIYELSPSVEDERLILVGYAKNTGLPEIYSIPLLGINPMGPQLFCGSGTRTLWEHPTLPSTRPHTLTCENTGDESLLLSSIRFASENEKVLWTYSPLGNKEIPPKKSITFVLQPSIGSSTPEGVYNAHMVMQTNEFFRGPDPKDAISSVDVSAHVVRSPAVIDPVQWDIGSVDSKDTSSKTFNITMVGGHKLLGWEVTFDGAEATLFSAEPASYQHGSQNGDIPALKVNFHPQEKFMGKDIEARLHIKYRYEAKGKPEEGEFRINPFLGHVIAPGELRAQQQEKVVLYPLSPGATGKTTLPFSLTSYGFSTDADVLADRRWTELRLEGADASFFQVETALEGGLRTGLVVSVKVPPETAARTYRATVVAKATLTMRNTRSVIQVLARWPIEVILHPSSTNPQKETSP